MAVTVIVTAWLSVRSGEALVGDVVQDLQHEVAARAVSVVNQTLEPPHLLDGLNDGMLTSGLLDPADHDQLQGIFLRQLHSFPTVGYVQLGTEDGHFVGVERVDDGFRVERTDPELRGKSVWALDERGERVGDPIEDVPGYRTTERPWYRSAIDSGGPTWSPIYQFSSREEVRLGITAVRPWVVDDVLRGVLGADIVLAQLGDQLGETRLREGGRVFLVERTGDLVAHNTVHPPFRIGADRIAQRLPAADAPDALTVAAAQALDPLLRNLHDPIYQELDFENDVAYLFATPVQDGRGIDWVAVVALPRADFTPELRANTTRTMWLVGLATLFALAIGFVAWRWVGGPLLQLADAATALARGEQLPLPRSRMSELASLSDAFARMRIELDARQDAVARARDEALVARRTAEEASRAKSTFLANMSHELRTPLNAILGYTEMLWEDASTTSATRADLDRILRAGRHLIGLVSDVLDLSRVEAGHVELDMKEQDLPTILADVARAMDGVVAEGGNQLQVVAPETLSVKTDEQKVRQCLINLIGNAAKYTKNGWIRMRIVVGGEYVHVEVRDTGVGIPKAHLRDLFEPFAQVGGEHQQAGTGLGLTITREYARALGGDVTVRSKVGKGTTFTLSLPMAPPS